jgi:predicted O-methyltransferase YrrM
MSQELWSAVDRFLADHLLQPDPSLEAALQASTAAGLPPIQVSPTQGKLLMLLAQVRGARRILEIGTLGGYSTIWLARALPADGRLISLEANPKHAEVARSNIARAGLSDVVEIRVGRAQDSLPQMSDEGIGPFDLIFIDADKPSYVEYLRWAIKLSRGGTVIIADNVVRAGAIVDPSNLDPTVEAARRFHEQLAAESRLNTTAIQTVGSKGYDGFAIGIVSAGD